MYQRTNIQRGMAVTSRDGVHLGRIIDVTSDSIIIEKGQFFFLKDFQVSLSDIATVRGDEVCLLRDHSELRKADTDAAADEPRRPAVTDPESQYFPLPHEPPMTERRAAGPGWDPLSVDEELEKKAPRMSGPDTKPPTRY